MREIVIEILKYVAYAALILMAISILYMIYCSFVPFWRKFQLIQKARKYRQKYKTQILGEVVGRESEERMDWLAYVVYRIGRRYHFGGRKKEEFKYFVYSPIVKYEVAGFTYEKNAGDYTRSKPIIGRKALVVYCDWNPEDAYVWIQRKYRKRLKIWKKDEEYVYCACGLKKNIRIPIAETEEGAVPGRFLIHKYGFYHLEQPEEVETTFEEMLENPLLEKRDEYK